MMIIITNQKKMQVEETWVMVKQPIWIHKNQQFLKGIIKQIYKDIITCLLENGDTLKVKRHDIFHRNPMPTQYSRTDLMENDLINQPQILQHLTLRFKQSLIYTFVQNTLIAVNPYQMIDSLYTHEKKDFYIRHVIKARSGIKEFEPHIYSITADAIGQLFQQKTNQAIVISGESGAGKTQANKQCLRFMAHFFAQEHHKTVNDGEEEKKSIVEKAIILSNPILQAFGNSKTIRNNNSSRFGKYLSITVDTQNKSIKNAQIFNYLLEKSRIILRSKEQQNFHIFYQFLIKTSKADKIRYNLLNQESNQELTFQDFLYTKNQTMSHYSAHPQVNFQNVQKSLKILPDENTYDYVCRILSSILHLGNLEPYEDDNLDYCEIMPQSTFSMICKMLEIDEKILFQSLTSYSIKVGGQDLIKSFSKRQVQQLIHSLSKTLYEKLFQWLIAQINQLCSSENIQKQQKSVCCLGFLDIYGFEVLKINSLQQLFINYTNERLHQIYLKKIFKLEKEHFISEGLQHKFKQISFQDNIKVIELIDYDSLSVFNLLDQWCSVASPDQSTFITKLRFNHKKHQRFPSANLNLLSTQFMIRHSPQDVEYNVVGFRQKNKDLLREEIKITLRSSKLQLLKDMFTEKQSETEGDLKSHRLRKFLSSKFRKEMNTLVDDLLSQSQLHFIRCIKSNGEKKPLDINEEVVYSQIKYLGILDTIKIKKMGYCVKVKYEDLDKRFSWLVRNPFTMPAFANEIKTALNEFLPRFTEQEMLYGRTKVFFRDFSYTILLKKYHKLYQYMNEKAHILTSLFIKNNYLKKRSRKVKNRQIVRKYCRSFIQQKAFKKKCKQIKLIQKAVLNFLSFKGQEKKLKSIETVQKYIKRTVAVRERMMKLRMAQKVILTFKRLVFRKQIMTKIVVEHTMNKYLFELSWKKIHVSKVRKIEKYIHGFMTRKRDNVILKKALVNEKNVLATKCMINVEVYLKAFNAHVKYVKYVKDVVKIQSLIRASVIAKKYNRLRDKAIIIQRAYRDHIFRKKGAKTLFQTTYKTYSDNLIKQNQTCRNLLYDSPNSEALDLNKSVIRFLNKFKQKISLFYFIIDFQAYVDLDIVYPDDSWIHNYLEIHRECLEKNDPLQYIDVGETFSIAASTTKLFIWGMHESYTSLEPDSFHQIKTKMPVEHFQINKNKLQFSYVKEIQSDKSSRKNIVHIEHKNFKIASTVAKDYNLENGKVYLCCPNQLRLIKGIPANERVLQISCGKAHTILRTSSKKVYTFGFGNDGQLGHHNRGNQDKPRCVVYFQNIKTAHPIQVCAGFTSSIVLMSNKKIYWFGKNGSLQRETSPVLLQLKQKSPFLSNSNDTIPCRLISTWSRTMGVIAITVLSFNGKFKNNGALRAKTADLLISKWQESGINSINPPFTSSVSDHLEQCHVKLPKKVMNIQPESTKILKEMKQKVRSIQGLTTLNQSESKQKLGTSKSGAEFSFANTQRSSIWK